MALQQIRIGAVPNAAQYDDADFDSAIEADQPIKAGTPIDPTDVLRLGDVGTLAGDVIGPAGATDEALARFDTASGKKLQNSTVKVTDAGEMTNASQPAFLVKPAGDQLNIATGGVTVVLDTEIFDQNNDFAANVFTAPVTGRYQLNAFVELHSLDQAATWYRLDIVTSNRTYAVIIDPTQFAGDIPEWSLSLSVLADMDAADTAHLIIHQNGGAAQTDIIAAGTYFSGFLAC